jgi:SAM-dependent methyltransferase
VRGHFYGELAPFWPLLSPVSDYEGEAAYVATVLRRASIPVRDVLELGSGGGHMAAYLGRDFSMTLTDLSEDMLAVSRALCPTCRHFAGDMRTLRLGETFDAVFVHDAIEYMTTRDDLRAAMETAFVHCRPGGIAVFVPDATRETLELGSDHGGSDGEDGRGARLLEWTWDPDPNDDWVQTEYSFVVRDTDGTIRAAHESHRTGVFPEACWMELMRSVGFEPERLIEETDEDRPPRVLFAGHRR